MICKFEYFKLANFFFSFQEEEENARKKNEKKNNYFCRNRFQKAVFVAKKSKGENEKRFLQNNDFQ